MSNVFFKGTKDELYKHLTQNLNIIEEKASSRDQVGSYQLIPLKEQIDRIYNSSSKTGKIYYTKHYFVTDHDDKSDEPQINEAFDLCTVSAEIID